MYVKGWGIRNTAREVEWFAVVLAYRRQQLSGTGVSGSGVSARKVNREGTSPPKGVEIIDQCSDLSYIG